MPEEVKYRSAFFASLCDENSRRYWNNYRWAMEHNQALRVRIMHIEKTYQEVVEHLYSHEVDGIERCRTLIAPRFWSDRVGTLTLIEWIENQKPHPFDSFPSVGRSGQAPPAKNGGRGRATLRLRYFVVELRSTGRAR